MAENTNKVIAIDIKTHLKMAMPICEIEGFAKGCEITFPDAAKAFKEIGGKAHALLEAWYALESEFGIEDDCQKCRAEMCGGCQVAKERDELKAKLEQERMNKCDEVTAKRLAEAERCIDGVFSAIENDCSDEVNKALSIIRAYREKEAAR